MADITYPSEASIVTGCSTVQRSRLGNGEQGGKGPSKALERAFVWQCDNESRAALLVALQTLGEKRAIAALDRAASQDLDSLWQRRLRVAAQALRSGDKTDDTLKQLRKDLDEVREENRKLKEQLGGLEARIK